MKKRIAIFSTLVFVLGRSGPVHAQDVVITYAGAVTSARRAAPDLRVARGREVIARNEIRVAGAYPNPTLSFGTSTQASRFSTTGSFPLVVFGQLGAAENASKAELATVQVESDAAWADVKLRVERAFIALWRAEELAKERERATILARRLEGLVQGRVELGAAADIELLRVRAERLRAEADEAEARQAVLAAASELGRWIGHQDGVSIRTQGGLVVPSEAPPLAALMGRTGINPLVRREEADAKAAEARAQREKTLVRPLLILDLGVDAMDPSLATTNYRGQLGVEVPLFNQRGGLIERERSTAALARSRGEVAAAQLIVELSTAYRSFEAASARSQALESGIIPAAEAAAKATDESYSLGRAPLLAVLDATRLRIEANVSLRETQAAQANAWAEIERVAGLP